MTSRVAESEARASLTADASTVDAGPDPAKQPLPPARRPGTTRALSKGFLRHHPATTRLLIAVAFTPALERPGVREAFATHPGSDVPIRRRIARECGFDPVAELEWLSVGFTGLAGAQTATVVVSGRWTRTEAEGCLARLAPSIGVEPDGAFTAIRRQDTIWLRWLDDHTFIVALEPREVLDERARGELSLADTRWGKALATELGADAYGLVALKAPVPAPDADLERILATASSATIIARPLGEGEQVTARLVFPRDADAMAAHVQLAPRLEAKRREIEGRLVELLEARLDRHLIHLEAQLTPPQTQLLTWVLMQAASKAALDTELAE
jgi:hypothetical protein